MIDRAASPIYGASCRECVCVCVVGRGGSRRKESLSMQARCQVNTCQDTPPPPPSAHLLTTKVDAAGKLLGQQLLARLVQLVHCCPGQGVRHERGGLGARQGGKPGGGCLLDQSAPAPASSPAHGSACQPQCSRCVHRLEQSAAAPLQAQPLTAGLHARYAPASGAQAQGQALPHPALPVSGSALRSSTQ